MITISSLINVLRIQPVTLRFSKNVQFESKVDDFQRVSSALIGNCS